MSRTGNQGCQFSVQIMQENNRYITGETEREKETERQRDRETKKQTDKDLQIYRKKGRERDREPEI